MCYSALPDNHRDAYLSYRGTSPDFVQKPSVLQADRNTHPVVRLHKIRLPNPLTPPIGPPTLVLGPRGR